MKRTRVVLSFVLALLMAATAFAPLSSVVLAEENKDRYLLEISDLKKDVQSAVRSVQDIEPQDEKEKELVDKFNEAARDINRELQISEERVMDGVGNSVYDLTTIPVRVQLLIRIGRAIRFATTELSNKVVAAHTKIAEYILTGILYVVNPFASEGQIMEYIERFEPLAQELLSYPDLQPHDIATIYKKAAFSRELSEARRALRSLNPTTRKFRGRQLQEAIAEGSRMWWRISVTCGELDEQIEKVHAEMEKVIGPKIRVEKIEFMEGHAGYIALNKKTRLRPVIFPNEVKNKDVIIYSSNPYIARVSGGEIIPAKTGSVIITVVSKDNGVKAEFELYIVEPGGFIDAVPPLQPTGNNYLFEVGPTPGGDDVPPVSNDKTQVSSVDFSINYKKLEIGETFDLSTRALVFPVEAIDKNLEYSSENDRIAQVDQYTGQVLALQPGKVKIFARSHNGKIASTTIEVVAKEEEKFVQITNIQESERKAGIFTLTVEAERDFQPYRGYVTLVLRSGDREQTRRVYMQNGKSEFKFNGFQFGVWRKDFTATVKAGGVTQEYNFSFK